MTIILERTNFALTNIILSQRKSFTFEDILKEAQTSGLHIDPRGLANMLTDLVDAGLINDFGINYSLSSIMTKRF